MKLADTGLTAQDIKDKVNKYMIETYERFDFLAETAKDQYIYDEKGEKYLDFYAGIAVNSAGSCNEKVVEAVVNQAKTLMHTFNYPYTIPQALLAEKVCTTIGMDKIYFQNTGTEANEAMIKMARKYGIEKYGPNRYHIVTAKMGFHGRTFGSMSATGQPGNGCCWWTMSGPPAPRPRKRAGRCCWQEPTPSGWPHWPEAENLRKMNR